ncbi:MAG: hypothetical protein ACREMP_08455 [Candidatus Tyrphobacter sp.]
MMDTERLDVGDLVPLRTPDGWEMEFTVVALLEEEDGGASYAVLAHEPDDDANDDEGDETFVVADEFGNLLEDNALAQEVLDDYLAQTDEEEEAQE